MRTFYNVMYWVIHTFADVQPTWSLKLQLKALKVLPWVVLIVGVFYTLVISMDNLLVPVYKLTSRAVFKFPKIVVQLWNKPDPRDPFVRVPFNATPPAPL